MGNRTGNGTRRPPNTGSGRGDLSFVHFDIKNTGKSDSHSREYEPRTRSTKRRRAPLPLFWMVAVDVLIAALFLLLFSLFYFILPKDYSGTVVKLPQASASQSVADSSKQPPASSPSAGDASAQPSASPPESASAAQGMWRQKFADKFTNGEIVKDDTSYKSANINVKIGKVQKVGLTYFVADIYLADIKYFKTAFASGKYEDGNGDHAYKIAQKNNAVIAINGDNSPRNKGPVVRNGDLYPYKVEMDVCVLNNDGTMQTFSPEEFNIKTIETQGAWQAWTFGPMLLKNGQPMKKGEFNGTVNPKNPRSAIGYYEPGHYCFLLADGRQGDYSEGLTTEEMSQVFYDLGCKAAFNLDGGQSAEMAFMGDLVNKPFDNGRPINDIVYIADQ